MWQNLLFGLDPAQLIDTTVSREDSAANAPDLPFPIDGKGVPQNQGFIVHGMNVFQSGGAVTARRLTIGVTGPITVEQVIFSIQVVAAADVLVLGRPLFVPPGFSILVARNGFDALSTIAYTIWWQRVSLPAKRALDKTRSPSPRRLDEIFMLGEG